MFNDYFRVSVICLISLYSCLFSSPDFADLGFVWVQMGGICEDVWGDAGMLGVVWTVFSAVLELPL